MVVFFFSSRRRHTRCGRDWSSDVCSSDLDPGEEPRALQELHREGPDGRVVGRRVVEPRARVTVDDAGQEPQVVVDHAVEDRPGRDVDHPRVRLPEEEQEEEEPLLVGLEHRRGLVDHIERDRRHDYDRLLVLVERGDRVPEGDELGLEGVEPPGDLVRWEGERGGVASDVVNGHGRAFLYTTRPRAGPVSGQRTDRRAARAPLSDTSRPMPARGSPWLTGGGATR